MPDLFPELVSLWQQLMPSEAYVSGLPDTFGRIFYPDAENRKAMESRISSLWKETVDLRHRSFLRWARSRNAIQEPHQGIQEAIKAYTDHLMRTGPGSPIIGKLLVSITDRLILDMEAFDPEKVPLEMRFMVINRLGVLLSYLNRLPGNFQFHQEQRALLSVIDEMWEMYDADDIKGASSGELLEILDSGDGTLGRDRTFDIILRDLHSCSLRTDDIESMLRMDLYNTMPDMKEILKRSSDRYGVGMDTEEVTTAMTWERRLKANAILEFLSEERDECLAFADSSFMDVPRTGELRIVETPPYLTSSVRIGSIFNFDGLSGKPSSKLYINTRNQRMGHLSVPELYMFIIREDLGSRTVYFNSFRGLTLENNTIDLLDRSASLSMAGALSRFIEDIAMKKLRKGPGSGFSNGTLVEAYGDDPSARELIMDLEYISARDRVMDIISGLCDARVNSGKQSLPDLIRWVHIVTGIDNASILRACMKALIYPGMCSTRMVAHKGLTELYQVALGKEIDPRMFLRRVTSAGYPELGCMKDRMMDQESRTFSR